MDGAVGAVLAVSAGAAGVLAVSDGAAGADAVAAADAADAVLAASDGAAGAAGGKADNNGISPTRQATEKMWLNIGRRITPTTYFLMIREFFI